MHGVSIRKAGKLPEGQRENSQGQRPWERRISRNQAVGLGERSDLPSGLQPDDIRVKTFLGRCPKLISRSPSGCFPTPNSHSDTQSSVLFPFKGTKMSVRDYTEKHGGGHRDTQRFLSYFSLRSTQSLSRHIVPGLGACTDGFKQAIVTNSPDASHRDKLCALPKSRKENKKLREALCPPPYRSA